jgi:hypothetical protein
MVWDALKAQDEVTRNHLLHAADLFLQDENQEADSETEPVPESAPGLAGSGARSVWAVCKERRQNRGDNPTALVLLPGHTVVAGRYLITDSAQNLMNAPDRFGIPVTNIHPTPDFGRRRPLFRQKRSRLLHLLYLADDLRG